MSENRLILMMVMFFFCSLAVTACGSSDNNPKSAKTQEITWGKMVWGEDQWAKNN